MSQPTPEPTPTPAQQGQQPPPVYVAPASQADLDRIIGERLARERDRYKDYDEAKKKAAEWDQAEERNRSELEKAQKRADEAEKRAADNELRATRAEVAAVKGVPATLLAGSNRAELEASADALIEFRGQQATPPAKQVSHVAPVPSGNAKGGDAGKAEAARRFGTKTP